MKKKMIISRYNEDISWVKEYEKDFDYIIYNKGKKLETEYKSLDVDNIGNNQRDIFHFIYENYSDLPDIMIFVQGHPFDHCKKDSFDKLVYNETLTSLEDLRHLQNMMDENGGYQEGNDSWYVNAHNNTWNQTCKWNTLDEFMDKTFTNYKKLDKIRFTPGSQYIITKDIAKHYSKNFWLYMMDILHKNNMTEGHIIERSLLEILKCYLEPINELKDDNT
jgi:hypothetical protein